MPRDDLVTLHAWGKHALFGPVCKRCGLIKNNSPEEAAQSCPGKHYDGPPNGPTVYVGGLEEDGGADE